MNGMNTIHLCEVSANEFHSALNLIVMNGVNTIHLCEAYANVKCVQFSSVIYLCFNMTWQDISIINFF